ncbi:hypothetical protein BsIDN1_30640 [Bacillus safensis]|uniref:Uncharacterized protein n=1 Tax=Bacillus safensis TaxID=561879 RepID=A0A5S9MD41_BACIA|nr:hypothetical protein BsIDN1_30640 [Bacillus safensis]
MLLSFIGSSVVRSLYSGALLSVRSVHSGFPFLYIKEERGINGTEHAALIDKRVPIIRRNFICIKKLDMV